MLLIRLIHGADDMLAVVPIGIHQLGTLEQGQICGIQRIEHFWRTVPEVSPRACLVGYVYFHRRPEIFREADLALYPPFFQLIREGMSARVIADRGSDHPRRHAPLTKHTGN